MTPHLGGLMRVILLVCSCAGFAGAGIAVAMRGYHHLEHGGDERGFAAVAILLSTFSALCAGLVSGASAIIALFLPLGLAGYVFGSQRLGVFSIDRGATEVRRTRKSEQKA